MGASLQRIDGAYLYEVGAALRKVADLEDRDYTAFDLYIALTPVRTAVQEFLYSSIFSGSLKTVLKSGGAFIQDVSSFILTPGADTDWSVTYPQWRIANLKAAFRNFEAILTAELQTFALYHVAAKGGLDTGCLTDRGQDLFPLSLADKVPEAVADVIVGARCLAFGLWTAMAFHYHRANEAVLRR